MPSQIDQEVLAGQACYTKSTLTAYDFLVLGVSNRFIWKCPTHHLLKLYNTHISSNHMDIGVGTGYFLDRCTIPSNPNIVLVDLNANSLEKTACRIRRHHPTVYRRNVLEPLELEERDFDSIGMNYLLHCLPGDLHTKGIVFDHIADYLNSGGTVFGSTLLHEGVYRGVLAKRLMEFYNTKGIFCNRQDNLDSLQIELASRFCEIHVEVIGCTALLWARKESP